VQASAGLEAMAAVDAAMARAVDLEDAGDDDIDAIDVIDPDLFPIFEEEAMELLPTLGAAMREWGAHPTRLEARSTLLRALHTLKGSARLAGAMRMGEMAHRLESALEALDVDTVTTEQIEPLFVRLDAIEADFNVLRALGEADSDPLKVEPAAAPTSPAADAAPAAVPHSDNPETFAPSSNPVPSLAPAALSGANQPALAAAVRHHTHRWLRVERFDCEPGQAAPATARY
jgi:chemosensory pili system protein ChpA (sensor histidine kinase/response regulator)